MHLFFKITYLNTVNATVLLFPF